MSAIGPGDWVEAILLPGQDASSRAGFVPGQMYVVVSVERDGPHFGFVIADMPPSRHPTGAWASENFRPIYRPKSDFIKQLQQPAPDVVRELIAAD